MVLRLGSRLRAGPAPRRARGVGHVADQGAVRLAVRGVRNRAPPRARRDTAQLVGDDVEVALGGCVTSPAAPKAYQVGRMQLAAKVADQLRRSRSLRWRRARSVHSNPTCLTRSFEKTYALVSVALSMPTALPSVAGPVSSAASPLCRPLGGARPVGSGACACDGCPGTANAVTCGRASGASHGCSLIVGVTLHAARGQLLLQPSMRLGCCAAGNLFRAGRRDPWSAVATNIVLKEVRKVVARNRNGVQRFDAAKIDICCWVVEHIQQAHAE
mmetsp:Transcript_60866/g.175351  ORF Transcript_60866/g.175351 Transcript_60866/m.175351 type:complete len:272 (-) Transcript_60866:121-936(-)